MEKTLELIIKYGLSIRKIPDVVVSLQSVRHYQKGDTIVEKEHKLLSFDKAKNYFSQECFKGLKEPVVRIDEENKKIYNRYVERRSIPSYAGYWLVTTSPKNTRATMDWTFTQKHITRALTLEEAVDLHIKKVESMEN